MSGTGTPCPNCGAELGAGQLDPDGMLTCDCGHRCYAGYLREYEYVTTRRQWLWDRIAKQSTEPDPRTMIEYGIWPSGVVTPPPKPRRTGSTQVLLVSLGAALLIVAAIVFVAVAWELIGQLGQMLALALATSVATVAAIGLRHRVPRTAEALAVVAMAMGLVLAAAAPIMGMVPTSWSDPSNPYTLLVCAGVVAWGVGMGRWSGLVTWTWLGWVGVPVLLGSALALTSDRMGTEQLGLTAAAGCYLVLAAVLVTIPLRWDWIPRSAAAGLSLMVSVGFTAALLTYEPPVGALVVVAAALLILLLNNDRIGTPAAAIVGWPLFGLWLALIGLLMPGSTAFAALAGVVGVGLLFAVRRSGIALAVVTAGALWTTWMLGQDSAPAVLFAIAGLGLFALALFPDAAPVAWLGALVLEVSLLLQIGDVPFFEVPTLCLGALFLIAGLLQLRAGERHSIIVYGPAATAALLPSSLLVWDQVWTQPALIRFGIVLVAGVVVLLVGVREHMLGLVIPAAVAISIAAAAQIFATLDTLPRWLALGIAGVVLITAGARVEWVRGKGRETSAWLQSLD